MESEENNLLIMDRSLDTLWAMDMDSGMIHNVIRGHTNIMEFCGAMMMEKLSCLRDVPIPFKWKTTDFNLPLNRMLLANLLSSFVTLQDHLIVCNPVGQNVLVLKKNSEVVSSIEFLNLGTLGLPYWLSSSLERVYPSGGVTDENDLDHVRSYKLFPGRVDIHLVIDVPGNTELVEPLDYSCVWRQARGTAMVFLAVMALLLPLKRLASLGSGMMSLTIVLLSPNQSQMLPQKSSQLNVETLMIGKLILIVSSIQAREQAR